MYWFDEEFLNGAEHSRLKAEAGYDEIIRQ